MIPPRSRSSQRREPRYTSALRGGDHVPLIPASWDELKSVDAELCDCEFLDILKSHGFSYVKPPVPLLRRYTARSRRWTKEEFAACFDAWESGTSLTLIAAALNRNPQDIIYRLLDHCHRLGISFSEAGRSEGAKNWTPKVAECATRLFEAGLPAWKIAALFQVDFEHAEKKLFIGRAGYGHYKRNPFSINTAHKHLTNEQVLSRTDISIRDVFDAFAGEGKTTEIIARLFPSARVLACESDTGTLAAALQKSWEPNVTWVGSDNLLVFQNASDYSSKFDLIDLDPFVTCHQQLDLVWGLLRSQSLLFVTFGGEYRRSFIVSNRKAIARRYGFTNFEMSNADYLRFVPQFFLGWVAKLASSNLFSFSIVRAVRYANNCRFWLRLRRAARPDVDEWFSQNVIEENEGYCFRSLTLPRFADVRQELDNRDQLGLFT